MVATEDSPEGRLLSYGSVVLRNGDLDLFQIGGWLNDRVMTFASEYMLEQLSQEERESIELVCASTCEVLKFDGGFASFLSDFAEKRMLFFIVNNNADPRTAGGTHWSLLVWDGRERRFLCFDSLPSPEKEAPSVIAENAGRFLTGSRQIPPLLFVPCPKQPNSSDCGVFVLEFIRFILKGPTDALEKLQSAEMNNEHIRERRQYWRSLITSLAEEEDKS